MLPILKRWFLRTPTGFDPHGPVFVSYRQSDGTQLADELTWLLRAAGIPVWRDKDDLPPGDTEQRLQEALRNGLSGAVLIVTPEIENSSVVREVETPLILRLHKTYPGFGLGIANAVRTLDGKTDYSAPDRLLKKRAQFQSIKQYGTHDRTQRRALVGDLFAHRLDHARTKVATSNGVLTINLQTRQTPHVNGVTEAALDVRVRAPKDDRLPLADGLKDLADCLTLLSSAFSRTNATSVTITGGGHLSVALAVGMTFPATLVGQLSVVDSQGHLWRSGTNSTLDHNHPILTRVRSGTDSKAGAKPAQDDVLVYLDLLESQSDQAFEDLILDGKYAFREWLHLRLTDSGLIDPNDAGRLAAEAAYRIRELSDRNGNGHVHLLLRCPFPMAVLVGRLLNTLVITAYEWEHAAVTASARGRGRYAPCLRLHASAGRGAIDAVLL
jgi:hypothetical protein